MKMLRSLLSLRLPWVEPLLVASLHVPLSGLAWLVFGGGLQRFHQLKMVLAWQLAAWPMLAGLALATLSLPLALLSRYVPRSSPRSRRAGLFGLALNAAASYLFLTYLTSPLGLLSCWLCALGAASLYHVSLRSKFSKRTCEVESAG